MKEQSKIKSSLDGRRKEQHEDMSDEFLEKIATEMLGITTLETRNDEGLDIYVNDEYSITARVLKEAFQKVYAAGRANEGHYEECYSGNRYVNRKINEFFGFTNPDCDFDPATEGEIAVALETIIDSVYNDGYGDGHLPIGGDCNICGMCAINKEEKLEKAEQCAA